MTHDTRDHDAVHPGRGDGERTGQSSLLRPVTAVLRHWVWMLVLPLLGAAVAAAMITMRGKEYVAESRFSPQGRDASTAGLAGLASQFGFALPTGPKQSESPDFYAALVRSRELLGELALTNFGAAAGGTGGASYLVHAGVRGSTPDERLREGIRKLEKRVTVGTDVRSGLVTVRTRDRSPELAVAMNERVLELVNEFNMRKRRTQAATERAFVEGRLAEAQRDLDNSERAVERFHMQNRRIESPQLSFELARLQRQVDRHHQLYTSLTQAFEEARIEEVRNTPVITVVDHPARSLRPAGSVARTILTGFVLGGILGLLVVFGREQIRRERADDPQLFDELTREWRTGPGRLLRRRERSRAAPTQQPPTRSLAADNVRTP